MYLESGDLIAVVIALGTSIALMITSAVANARLTRQRNYWRQFAMYDDKQKALMLADDCCFAHNPCQFHMYDNRTDKE